MEFLIADNALISKVGFTKLLKDVFVIKQNVTGKSGVGKEVGLSVGSPIGCDEGFSKGLA